MICPHVAEAKTARRTQVYVLDSSRKNYKGVNIQVNSRDLERAAKLSAPEDRFKGQLHNFKNHDNGAVTISLRNADSCNKERCRMRQR